MPSHLKWLIYEKKNAENYCLLPKNIELTFSSVNQKSAKWLNMQKRLFLNESQNVELFTLLKS